MAEPERWLRGPVDGVPALLQPVAHALLQARDDVRRVVEPLSADELWTSPGGAASVGFHLKHLAGALDRLFAYARGESLTAEQIAYLRSEKEPGDPPVDAASLLAVFDAAVDRAFAQTRSTREADLLTARGVGRQALPSYVLGLLFHAAEHTTRHAGQATTTAKIVSRRAGVWLDAIGYVRSSRSEPTDDHWDRESARIELVESMPAESLDGLDQFSHAEVLFSFHLVSQSKVVSGARHPRGNVAWPQVGIFAQRGRNRPNRLGATIVRVLRVTGRTLEVAGLDAVDGTPVVDIKPVVHGFLPRGEVRQPKWATELMEKYW